MNDSIINIHYRLSNIFHGGKDSGETCWRNVPKYFPNSLGHRYIKEYDGKKLSKHGEWRHNTNVISKIINDYLNDNNDITFNNNLPGNKDVIVHLRMGDVIDMKEESKITHKFIYKDVVIDVKQTHVHLIPHY